MLLKMVSVRFTLLTFWCPLHDVPPPPTKDKDEEQENLEHFALIVMDI